MLYSFEAVEVGFTEEVFDEESSAVLIGGFKGDHDAEGQPVYLMLQRTVDEDEYGFEGPYAEWCNQGYSCYDCVKSFELSRDRVRVVFNENSNLNINTEGNKQERLTELLITFSVDDPDFEKLHHHLQNVIFRDRRHNFSYRVN